MSNRIFIIAHAPLASALRQCVAHVFPDQVAGVLALDVEPNLSAEETLVIARQEVSGLEGAPLLVLTDVMGATPCNVARRLVQGVRDARLVTGVNVPMLWRAVTYRQQPLDELVARALDGGVQGVMLVETTKV